MTFTKILRIISFFGSRVQTLFAFSVLIKPVNLKILPDGTIYLKSPPRKRIQIEIRTYGTEFNFPDAISVGFLSSNLSADWRRFNCRAAP